MNLRDSGLDVIIGSVNDRSRKKAEEDNFRVLNIIDAVKIIDIVFLLIPDEGMPDLYGKQIEPQLKENAILCFASGYNIANGFIKPRKDIDIIMIAPRMIGVGVREGYLTGKVFIALWESTRTILARQIKTCWLLQRQ